MTTKAIGLVGLIFLAIIMAGCGAIVPGASTASEEGRESQQTQSVTPSVQPQTATETEANPVSASPGDAAPLDSIPQPVNELADEEYSWSQLLPRDGIFPVYDPQFAPADQAPYDKNELVIGVEINGEAKAYAIGPLNGREMVNDVVGGVPVLVTW